MKEKVISIIDSEKKWISISAPEQLKSQIMHSIQKQAIEKMIWMKVLKYASLTVSAVIIFLSSLLWINHSSKEKVVLIYPYHGETVVELVGSFNDWDARIKMELDKDTSLWKAELYLTKERIYEYQFIIDEVIYTTGNAENTISSDTEGDKALLFI